MLEVDVTGAEALTDGPGVDRIQTLCRWAFASAGVEEGHAGVEIVEEAVIHQLNLEHRRIDKPTDVLSFPVDGSGPTFGPRELGDIVVCPPFCESVERAIVHGALHLVEMDHETDNGEMLAVEAEILRLAESL